MRGCWRNFENKQAEKVARISKLKETYVKLTQGTEAQ